ncbi:MAG: tetratricopeptide repeat protein [Candidatus Sericytochromatia bacterium]
MLPALPPAPAPEPPQAPLAAQADALLRQDQAEAAIRLLAGRASAPALGDRLGRALMRAGRYEEAGFHYEAMLREHKRFAPAFYGLAWSWLAREQRGMALMPLAEAVRLQPAYQAGWRELGHCYYIMKRYDRAEAACDRAVAMAPSDAEAWRLLGLARWGQAKAEGALAAFEQASVLDARDALSRRMRGRLHLEAGAAAKAVLPLEEALALAPDHAETRQRLTAALKAQGRYLEAAKLMLGWR